jgi:O-antigen/teichoic acid export membrane protein
MGSGALLRLILSLGGIQAASLVVGWLRLKYVATTQGPAGVGVISLFDQFLAILVVLASFNIPFAAVKYLSEAYSRDRVEFRGRFRLYFCALLLLAGIIVSLGGVWLMTRGVAGLSRDVLSTGLIVFGLLSVPLTAFKNLLGNTLIVTGRVRTNAVLSLTLAALYLALVVPLLAWNGLAGLYTALSIALALILLPFLWSLRGDLFGPTHRSGSWRELWLKNRDALGFIAVSFALSFTQPLAFFAVRWILAERSSLEAVGYFQACYGAATYLSTILGQANASLLTPEMNKAISPEEKFAWATRYSRVLMLTTTAACAFLALFPELVLTVLFSSEFLPAKGQFFLFLLSEGLVLYIGIHQGLLIGLNYLRVHLVTSLISHACVAGGAFLLVPGMGIAGAALAFIAAQLAILVGSYIWLDARHRGGIPVASLGSAAGFSAIVLATGAISARLDLSAWALGARVLLLAGVLAIVFCMLTSDERLALMQKAGFAKGALVK